MHGHVAGGGGISTQGLRDGPPWARVCVHQAVLSVGHGVADRASCRGTCQWWQVERVIQGSCCSAGGQQYYCTCWAALRVTAGSQLLTEILCTTTPMCAKVESCYPCTAGSSCTLRGNVTCAGSFGEGDVRPLHYGVTGVHLVILPRGKSDAQRPLTVLLVFSQSLWCCCGRTASEAHI